MSDEKENYIYVPASADLQEKHKKLVWSGMLFVSLGLIFMAGSYLYMRMQGVYDKEETDINQILPFLLIFIPAYGVSILKQGLNDKKALLQAGTRGIMGLLLDKDKIAGAVSLLEGPTSIPLKVKKAPVFTIDWPKIDNFIVEPVRPSGKSQSPPFYKITIKGTDGGIKSSYFILRQYFKGREQEILDYVATRLPAENIILNDELLTKRE
ncbi:MAG: hypothetical protein KDI46_06135 [Alphaproteobacteria bacterium]|nr:hypothetical protein [Alphaproteobacteria bacterium]